MRYTTILAAALTGLTLFTSAAFAQSGPKPLGSPNWTPTPEYPVGWRGDGSGRFPAATPPTTWGRTIKGFYSELRCQAGKPSESPAQPKSAEQLNMGFVRDWMIIGPFDTDDFKTGVDKEIVKDEANVQPVVGEKVGENAWQKWYVSVGNQSASRGTMRIDFAQAYDKTQTQDWQNHPGTMQPWAGYAQTSVWSPEDGKVRLRVDGDSAKKIWWNGEPVKVPGQWDGSPVVNVKKGWNNLVVKAVSTKGAWNFCAHIAPAPTFPYQYDTKNIVYMTRMPGLSWCSPIIVGDKLFVSADQGTLVCVNKADGKALWVRSTTYLDGVDASEKERFAELASKTKQLEAACGALPAAINATVGPDGSKADASEALAKRIKEKCDLEGAIQSAMAKTDKKQYDAWNNDQDTSKYNLCSDGKNVWAAFWGGNKGIGANVVACFDLDGNRQWAHFCGQTGISEHGTHSSPALCGNILVYKTGEYLFGFEKATGKVAWQKKIGGGLGASAIPVHVGNEVIAYVPQVGLVKPSDGTILWKAPFTPGTPTPAIVDNVIYGVDEKDLFVGRIAADGGSVQTIAKAPWKNLQLHMPGTFTDSIVGSPLYDNGLLYVVSEGGGLNVIDAQRGTKVYSKALEILNPRLQWVFVVGICSSPALGGKYIFVRDDEGQTLVLAPGTQYEAIAKNLLVEYDKDGHQPESQSNFYFEGSRIYFRSREFLYCIGEK